MIETDNYAAQGLMYNILVCIYTFVCIYLSLAGLGVYENTLI